MAVAPIWSDEFKREGAPDPHKWTPELGYVRNEEDQYYTARSNNLRVRDGRLIIEAHKEPYTWFEYTSASITTGNDHPFLYGRFEIRAKVPVARGTWPAIWLLGMDCYEPTGVWPDCGEIDIMENIGCVPQRVWGTIHCKTYPVSQGAFVDIPNLAAAWHTYGLEWREDHLTLSFDGQPYFTYQNDGAGNNDTWPFSKPHMLILNLAIGGTWGGEQGIDDSIFPCRMLVDSVRVYA